MLLQTNNMKRKQQKANDENDKKKFTCRIIKFNEINISYKTFKEFKIDRIGRRCHGWDESEEGGRMSNSSEKLAKQEAHKFAVSHLHLLPLMHATDYYKATRKWKCFIIPSPNMHTHTQTQKTQQKYSERSNANERNAQNEQKRAKENENEWTSTDTKQKWEKLLEPPVPRYLTNY